MEFRRRKQPRTDWEDLIAALRLAEAAHTSRQRKRAQLAIANAQVKFRRMKDESIDMRQVLATNWSDVRTDAMEDALREAQDRLSKEEL